ncbi:MAG: DPP IV N-terminal domain-containing protein [Kiritimatiellae bacterium]|nr:DPP IV N-terminal domain-containing protein [Kiritimatiellia bacterium]
MKNNFQQSGHIIAISAAMATAAVYFTMAAEKDGGKFLTRDRGYEHCRWTPDGKQIVFDRYDYDKEQMDVWSMPSAGGAATPLTTDGAREPAVSPDGKSLAYIIERQDQAGIWSMDLAGANRKRLTQGHTDRDPSWSPDGGNVLFTRIANGRQGLWIMKKDGTNQRALKQDGETKGVFSPDGKKIVCERNLQIWVLNADGTGGVQLTREQENREPAWSPDGRRIVFTSQSYQPVRNVVIINADGTGKVFLTEGRNMALSPQFSPDGRQIIYCGHDDEVQHNIRILENISKEQR